MKWHSLFVAASLTMASPAVAAEGDEPKKQAAEQFSLAQAAFARKDFATAAAAFEQASALAPHVATQLNAAEAWERLPWQCTHRAVA